RSTDADLDVFESHRALLVAHAYRMLGDLGRAEDMTQEAWLRWDGRRVEVDSPRAYLLTLVTRLCLNELDSAKTRREESRSDRLPEPIDLDEGGIGRVELLDQVSMAFMLALQRLTPAERAVLLLRDVFDFDYGEIAALVGRSEPACRKLLERARQNVATEKRFFSTSPEAHRRLLAAFTQAATTGDIDALIAALAEDAVLITDGGPEGRRAGGIRNLQAPLHGARKIAAFVAATTARGAVLHTEIHELNGQPALVFYDEDAPFAALLLGVADGRIHRVFFHADVARLRYLGPRNGAS
ncbi:MAG TPA: sigma-70 family RNA polymerase sigma factor, partial [Blastocatellia bacterium]|nr:sigma-70 family RNA polymerase sigma factor [Blastocatellia bacterium]